MVISLQRCTVAAEMEVLLLGSERVGVGDIICPKFGEISWGFATDIVFILKKSFSFFCN